MKKYAVLQKDAIGGYLLLLCAVASLVLANVGFGERYLDFWNRSLLGHPVSHWIDDGLMAVFFLFVGLEIKREMLDVSVEKEYQKDYFPSFRAYHNRYIDLNKEDLFNIFGNRKGVDKSSAVIVGLKGGVSSANMHYSNSELNSLTKNVLLRPDYGLFVEMPMKNDFRCFSNRQETG